MSATWDISSGGPKCLTKPICVIRTCHWAWALQNSQELWKQTVHGVVSSGVNMTPTSLTLLVKCNTAFNTIKPINTIWTIWKCIELGSLVPGEQLSFSNDKTTLLLSRTLKHSSTTRDQKIAHDNWCWQPPAATSQPFHWPFLQAVKDKATNTKLTVLS